MYIFVCFNSLNGLPSSQWFFSILLENVRKPKGFFDVYRGYRSRILAWNSINKRSIALVSSLKCNSAILLDSFWNIFRSSLSSITLFSTQTRISFYTIKNFICATQLGFTVFQKIYGHSSSLYYYHFQAFWKPYQESFSVLCRTFGFQGYAIFYIHLKVENMSAFLTKFHTHKIIQDS